MTRSDQIASGITRTTASTASGDTVVPISRLTRAVAEDAVPAGLAPISVKQGLFIRDTPARAPKQPSSRGKPMAKKAPGKSPFDFAIPVDGKQVTARRAGDLSDLELCVSPSTVAAKIALRHMAKAINLALKLDYIESELDGIYHASRVKDGAVHIKHADYFGLGDGLMASFGKTAKSFSLTLKGPDPASPEGKRWIKAHGGGAIGGILNLVGRKLNLLQEFEDKVPIYVQQLLDRLEAKKVITDWNRDEWDISTTTIGLDVIMTPNESSE